MVELVSGKKIVISKSGKEYVRWLIVDFDENTNAWWGQVGTKRYYYKFMGFDEDENEVWVEAFKR